MPWVHRADPAIPALWLNRFPISEPISQPVACGKRRKKNPTEWWFLMELPVVVSYTYSLLTHGSLWQKSRPVDNLQDWWSHVLGKGEWAPGTWETFHAWMWGPWVTEALWTPYTLKHSKTKLFWWIRLSQQVVCPCPIPDASKCMGEIVEQPLWTPETVHPPNWCPLQLLSAKGELLARQLSWACLHTPGHLPFIWKMTRY